eukprot:Unigene11876_Nuclearia_a/m.36164 Unigene11876_Nuclearia_a/g.36164  ORF Unigene11876_Nuclearia_a/g.36164 Unigene11876_Nuclearia_a/m.36164 type:complete len:685 (+) Unigene11876_Nuclearia_a:123-2177(+)
MTAGHPPHAPQFLPPARSSPRASPPVRRPPSTVRCLRHAVPNASSAVEMLQSFLTWLWNETPTAPPAAPRLAAIDELPPSPPLSWRESRGWIMRELEPPTTSDEEGSPPVSRSGSGPINVALAGTAALSAHHGSPDDRLPRPLHSAAASNNVALVTEILNEGVIHVDKRNKHSRTALMGAAFFGHADMVRRLIARGADVDTRCNEGATALIYAAMGARRNVVEILLQHGAKRDLATHAGVTARIAARNAGDRRLARLIEARDVIAALPEEIALIVLRSLDLPALLAASLVSRRWRNLCGDAHIWQRICLARGWTEPSPRHLTLANPWKGQFVQRNMIERNWRRGKCNLVQLTFNDMTFVGLTRTNTCVLVKCHGAAVLEIDTATWDVLRQTDLLVPGARIMCSATSMTEEVFLIGTRSHGIHLWHARSPGELPRPVFSIPAAHEDSVSSLAIDSPTNTVASSSFDGKIKVWRLIRPTNDGEELHLRHLYTLDAHIRDIYAVCLYGELLISGGVDRLVKVWRNGQLERALEGHQNHINSIVVNDKLIYTGSFDGTVRVWAMEANRYPFVCSLEHGERVRTVHLRQHQLVATCLDARHFLWLWDHPGTIAQRTGGGIQGFSELVVDARVDRQRAVVTGQNGTVCIWDFTAGADMYCLPTAAPPPGGAAVMPTGEKPVGFRSRRQSA